MRPVKLIVDSTCDLPKEFLLKNDIKILPLGVSFKEETYYDGVDITVSQLYEKAKELKILPKTFALSIQLFFDEFKMWVDKGYDVIFICISSSLSSCYQNACIAAQDFNGEVLVFDSMNLSTGIGLQVLKAIKARNEGKSASEIVTILEDVRPRVRSQFAIETLDYLFKGGRCSALTFFFGKNLHIRPIIRVSNGKMGVYKKPRGKMVNALNELINIFKTDIENHDPDCVMITHSLGEDSKNYLFEELKKLIPEERIMITDAGSVISSHCGKGTIGILYIVNN